MDLTVVVDRGDSHDSPSPTAACERDDACADALRVAGVGEKRPSESIVVLRV